MGIYVILIITQIIKIQLHAHNITSREAILYQWKEIRALQVIYELNICKYIYDRSKISQFHKNSLEEFFSN